MKDIFGNDLDPNEWVDLGNGFAMARWVYDTILADLRNWFL